MAYDNGVFITRDGLNMLRKRNTFMKMTGQFLIYYANPVSTKSCHNLIDVKLQPY